METELEKAGVQSNKAEEDRGEEVKLKRKSEIIDEATSIYLLRVASNLVKNANNKRKVKIINLGLCYLHCISESQLRTHRQGKAYKNKHFRNRQPKGLICRTYHVVMYT